MTVAQAAALFGAAVLGGTLNSVAGGGSFFTFPTLIFIGILPVNANATSTVALWPGSLASAGAYRAELRTQRRALLLYGAVCMAGGVVGAMALLHTPQKLFLALVPYLLLLATLIFTFGNALTQRLRARLERQRKARAGQRSRLGMAGTLALIFVLALYGGFFGGGLGIMLLAMLALAYLAVVRARLPGAGVKGGRWWRSSPPPTP